MGDKIKVPAVEVAVKSSSIAIYCGLHDRESPPVIGFRVTSDGSPMKKYRMTMILLAASFAIGTAIGYGVMADRVPMGHPLWSWLAEPGLLLSLPIYILVGGVHGELRHIWWRSLAPCNGLAYAAIMAIALWARRYLQRKGARAAILQNTERERI
jgi:hypothetical protein